MAPVRAATPRWEPVVPPVSGDSPRCPVLTVLLSYSLWSQALSFSLVAKSCPTLGTPWTVACQAPPLSMGFSRQEYWSGLPFPSPGKLSDPGIEPESPASPAG